MIINASKLLSLAPIKDMVDGKMVGKGGTSFGLGEAGYDIRIQQRVEFKVNEAKRISVVHDHSFADRNNPYGEKETAGRFVLASAIEEFQMPDNLVGIVHDKSTWARRGLSVFNTVIEPGFIGGLTLELVYHGEEDLIIPAGSGIAQVVFHQTSCKAHYSGKYQFQSTNPEPARDSI